MNQIFILLIVFQFKHFLSDFPLQTSYMMGKFKPGWDFVLPLLAHVGVHGAFTLIICLCVNPRLWWLALVDVAVHFAMDRLKAGPKYLGRFKALNGKEFVSLSQGIEDYKNISKTNVEFANAVKLFKERLRGNTYFWWSLGADQLFHHCTHYAIIAALVCL